MSELTHPDSKTNDSEVVIGLIGLVGADLGTVQRLLELRLKHAGYSVVPIRVSTDIIPDFVQAESCGSEFERIRKAMDAGDEVRRVAEDKSALAIAVASYIWREREKQRVEHGVVAEKKPSTAYIVNSLKHPDEVYRLRQIYPQGFYLIAVHADRELRSEHLVDTLQMSEEQADELMKREEQETKPHGQRVAKAFHLADFFIHLDENEKRLRRSLWRIVELLFGHPYKTPTFDEYAMFLAFSAAVRSADLSRQVGAVVARDREVLATGANDCPTFGGGLYWPVYDEKKADYCDVPGGRDHTRGFDANRREQAAIKEDLAQRLEEQGIERSKVEKVLDSSRIADLTEYGRVVHAEMEALLCCARNGLSTRGATLYCTTFPCHNCTKHLIAAGVTRVVYVEPYPKSKAFDFHQDAIDVELSGTSEKVRFEPFIGIGPRRFMDIFSVGLGNGYPKDRKDKAGNKLKWTLRNSSLRVDMSPASYLELEYRASKRSFELLEKVKEQRGECDNE